VKYYNLPIHIYIWGTTWGVFVIIYDYGDEIPQREGSKNGTSAWRLASQCTDLALGNSFDDFLQGVHQVLLVTLVTLFPVQV